MSRSIKELAKEAAEHPEFISGIYNYCDRWCDRCVFTSRCANYHFSNDAEAYPECDEPASVASLEHLGGVFETTLTLLWELAEEEGIDLSDFDVEQAAIEAWHSEEEAAGHPCCRLSGEYAEQVDGWFGEAERLFLEKGEELQLSERLHLPDLDPLGEAVELRTAVEILRWYQHFIHVKLSWAVQSAQEERASGLPDIPNDSDGSAKIALIAMDRSVDAWVELRRQLPGEADRILDFLAILDRLGRLTEDAFPRARSFVRPGFDEVR